ncbi:Uncharacterised protein [Achromobacter xylosoxidans]|nr:Uncharacterised protein [Achromobacter xylosoxidans]CUI44315.1 Uncharacterised protein [Achromobacter xylosoxidans]CUI55796.1 Uncharacterised protein [Achromobacter xylosoxidans]CUI59247.1 Uncharacterised protein [Achromobacter xylosoxidans]CUI60238.1 Uncharacterised protein [Achromobacter xylosoxidans]
MSGLVEPENSDYLPFQKFAPFDAFGEMKTTGIRI